MTIAGADERTRYRQLDADFISRTTNGERYFALARRAPSPPSSFLAHRIKSRLAVGAPIFRTIAHGGKGNIRVAEIELGWRRRGAESVGGRGGGRRTLVLFGGNWNKV